MRMIIDLALISIVAFTTGFTVGMIISLMRERWRRQTQWAFGGWVARDKDYGLYFHSCSPWKDEKSGKWVNEGWKYKLFPERFPDVKWEDEKPLKVMLEEIK